MSGSKIRSRQTTNTEAQEVCKFQCTHLHCNHCFATKRGLTIHKAKCKWKTEFEVDKIVNHKGPVTGRKYLVRWKNYTHEWDTWEPRTNLHPDMIKEYEMYTGCYDHAWPHRCPQCDQPCASERGVKIHISKAHRPNMEKPQDFKGRLADKAVQKLKLEEQQKTRPTVKCENKELENVFQFKYLGSIFSANAEQEYDLKRRIAMAMTRCGRLSNIFDSKNISLRSKLRLYQAAVCSILTYGCETWDLCPKTIRRLNGANSTMLARITDKSIQQEARATTTSLNLVQKIRIRRLKWLGHILRAGPQSLMFCALRAQFEMGKQGNLLMDAPAHTSVEDLVPLAMDRATWRQLAAGIQ